MNNYEKARQDGFISELEKRAGGRSALVREGLSDSIVGRLWKMLSDGGDYAKYSDEALERTRGHKIDALMKDNPTWAHQYDRNTDRVSKAYSSARGANLHGNSKKSRRMEGIQSTIDSKREAKLIELLKDKNEPLERLLARHADKGLAGAIGLGALSTMESD